MPWPVTQAPAPVSRESLAASRAAAPGDAEQLVIAAPIDVAVRRYANDVRFRLFDSAVNFVEPDLRSEFRGATDHLRTIRFTGVTIEQVRENTGFDLAAADDLRETSAPTAEQLRLIREVLDPNNLRAGVFAD